MRLAVEPIANLFDGCKVALSCKGNHGISDGVKSAIDAFGPAVTRKRTPQSITPSLVRLAP